MSCGSIRGNGGDTGRRCVGGNVWPGIGKLPIDDGIFPFVLGTGTLTCKAGAKGGSATNLFAAGDDWLGFWRRADAQLPITASYGHCMTAPDAGIGVGIAG